MRTSSRTSQALARSPIFWGGLAATTFLWTVILRCDRQPVRRAILCPPSRRVRYRRALLRGPGRLGHQGSRYSSSTEPALRSAPGAVLTRRATSGRLRGTLVPSRPPALRKAARLSGKPNPRRPAIRPPMRIGRRTGRRTQVPLRCRRRPGPTPITAWFGRSFGPCRCSASWVP